MRASEVTGQIDNKGILRLNNPLIMREKKVKVVILMSEEEELEEKQWLSAMTNNPAFEFLNHEQENIYKITDGQLFHN